MRPAEFAAESRRCASHLSLAAAAAGILRGPLQKVTFTCGDELVVVPLSGISLSPGLLPSARASVQREKRMSVTYREGAIDSKRAHVQTAHYLPARRTRTEIIDKRILACIEMQKGYPLISFVFLYSEYDTVHICIGNIIFFFIFLLYIV